MMKTGISKGLIIFKINIAKQWQRIEKPEPYCGVGFRLPGHSIEHHLGIVLHDLNNFLHSPLNHESRIESLHHETWAKAITGYYRHNDI